MMQKRQQPGLTGRTFLDEKVCGEASDFRAFVKAGRPQNKTLRFICDDNLSLGIEIHLATQIEYLVMPNSFVPIQPTGRFVQQRFGGHSTHERRSGAHGEFRQRPVDICITQKLT